jgi:AcrR family transcriptional regulator
MKTAAGRDDRARRGPTPKAEDTRRRILAAALDLFQQRGFAETTMRDIARKADVATGAAYYYFPSKEAIVMAFYWHTHEEMDQVARGPLREVRDLRGRLRALIDMKLRQFGPYREFLGALFRSAGDPSSPLSPFGEETREIREQSIQHFREAMEGSDTRIPADLAPHLPLLLWLYQMGVILFWIHDRSPRQTRTQRLLDHSLDLIVRAIQVSRFPLFAPIRKAAVRLVADIADPTVPEEAR